MSPYGGPQLLRPDHQVDLFDCGSSPLSSWLATKAARNQAEGGSRTWVVASGARAVGFYASSAAAVLASEVSKRAARNQPEPLPALLLGRLAIDLDHQGKGLGKALLQHFILKSLEVAQITGVRLLLAHAKDDDAARFYARYGFEPSPVDQLTMMLLVKDARLAIDAP